MGLSLMQKKTSLLNEIRVCKIASQLLEAMVYLLDMNLVHDDLSHRNYLVEENLDVRFTSCRSLTIRLESTDFHNRSRS
jgi:serine/threonine protein kinase